MKTPDWSLTFLFGPYRPVKIILRLLHIGLASDSYALSAGMRDHDGPKTLGHKLRVKVAKPCPVNVAKGKALQCRDGHLETAILHEHASYARDDVAEIALIRRVHGADNDHHEDELVRCRLDVKGAVMDEWEGRGDMRPIVLEGFRDHLEVELHVLDGQQSLEKHRDEADCSEKWFDGQGR